MVTLADVKKGLNITDTYRDDELTMYLDEVLSFLRKAGISEGSITKGVVIIGVRDLFYGAEGNIGFSDYFYKRASQLAVGG